MKMSLARRLMQAHAPESLTLDKETLITFRLEDVLGLGLSETLFNIPLLNKGDSKITASEDIINIDPTMAE
jgi:hypothetical protein